MHTHVQWSVHLAVSFTYYLIYLRRWIQRRYASDVAFCIIRLPLTVDNSDMN
jgi:hypothetical protein